MKMSKFTEEQIAFALRQVEAGTRVISFARTYSVLFHCVPLNSMALDVLNSIEHKGDYVFPGRWGKGHTSDCKLRWPDRH